MPNYSVEELLDYEIERAKKEKEHQTMMEYFTKMLPEERQEIARKTARRVTRVLRRRG